MPTLDSDPSKDNRSRPSQIWESLGIWRWVGSSYGGLCVRPACILLLDWNTLIIMNTSYLVHAKIFCFSSRLPHNYFSCIQGCPQDTVCVHVMGALVLWQKSGGKKLHGPTRVCSSLGVHVVSGHEQNMTSPVHFIDQYFALVQKGVLMRGHP